MSLDINTPKGQKTVEDEKRAVEIFNRRFPLTQYLPTARSGDAASALVDALLVKDGEIIGVVETKCRYNITRAQLAEKWHDEWLLTYEKIEAQQIVAKALNVPLYGFLYLVDDDCLLVVKIWAPDGSAATMSVEMTTTQKTVNGGEVVRANAFVRVTGSMELRAA